jgi:hypothetical protein
MATVDEAAPAEGLSHTASGVYLFSRFSHGDLHFSLGKDEQIPGCIATAKQDFSLGKRLAFGDGHHPIDHILVQPPKQICVSDIHGGLIWASDSSSIWMER